MLNYFLIDLKNLTSQYKPEITGKNYSFAKLSFDL